MNRGDRWHDPKAGPGLTLHVRRFGSGGRELPRYAPITTSRFASVDALRRHYADRDHDLIPNGIRVREPMCAYQGEPAWTLVTEMTLEG